jgi:geranylgeranyl diphosphate synthase type I
VVRIDKIVQRTKSAKAENAKKTLQSFVELIDSKLENYFDSEIKNAFGVSRKEFALSKQIWEHIAEHNLRPAKRLRGSFIYYGYKLLGGKNEKAIIDAAMSIELIHTALLMHDDFMDQDDTRRGKPTTHEHFQKIHKNKNWRFDSKHYGAAMAMDIGDIALLTGYEILGRSNFDAGKKIETMNKMLRGVVNTGFGQAYDVTLEAMGEATEQDIIDLHYAKTGIYTYENPLHTGAILAGASSTDLSILSKYAIPGGITFQLQDDILGLYGDPEKTGKPAHSDLRQGKMTLLIIKALEFGSASEVKRLKQIWGKRNVSQKEAEEARKIVIETGSLDYSKKVSVKWAKKAQKAIPLMKQKNWNKEAIDYLDGIAQYMIEREM